MRPQGTTTQEFGLKGKREKATEDISQAVDRHRDQLKALFPVPPPRAPRRKQAGATVSALVLLLGAGLWWLDPAYKTEHFDTQIGQIIHVDLTDGSRLALDTDTGLDVQWHLRSRRISLDRGRAQFDVAHSTWRPFSVAAGPAQVRVLGTRFDVWRKGSTTEVSVYRGKVAVWRTGEAQQEGVELTPDQQVVVDPSDTQGGAISALQPNTMPVGSGDAWKAGRLVFHNTPLAEVVASLQRYRGQAIVLDDSHGGKLATLTLSGVFESGNTDQLLAMLPDILPVNVTRTSGGDTRIRSR